MRFRLPAVPAASRPFIAEVGIVVLGVLIALGGERPVSNYLERQEAEFTEAALRAELLNSAKASVERLVIEDCLRQRIAHLDAKLQREGKNWTGDPIAYPPYLFVQPTLASVYRPMRRPWNSDVWQMAISTGMIRHIPRERVSAYSGAYQTIRRMRETNDVEYRTLPSLGPLRADGDLDPNFVADTAVALTQLDMANSTMVGNAHQFLNRLKEMNLGYTPTEAGLAEIVSDQRKIRGGCVKNIKVSF